MTCKSWADASRNSRRLPLNIFSGKTMRLRWYASLAEGSEALGSRHPENGLAEILRRGGPDGFLDG